MKRIAAHFYATAAGREPVRDWLLSLDRADRKIIGEDIATAEFGWPVGMPICRSLGGGLFEIRSNLSGQRIARTIFGISDERIVLLNGFVKKSRKTPKTELDLARKRMKDLS